MTSVRKIAYSIDRDRTAKDHALRVRENRKRYRPKVQKRGNAK